MALKSTVKFAVSLPLDKLKRSSACNLSLYKTGFAGFNSLSELCESMVLPHSHSAIPPVLPQHAPLPSLTSRSHRPVWHTPAVGIHPGASVLLRIIAPWKKQHHE